MVLHTIKHTILFFLLLQCIIGLGQCKNASLYKQFNSLQRDFNAVSFVVEKLQVNYNSFDLISDVDSIWRKEKFICVRKNNHFIFFKESLNSLKPYSNIYYNDTAAYFSNKTGTYKQNLNQIKYTEFLEALWFLHHSNDSFFHCTSSDTVMLLHKNTFSQISHFEDEYGPGVAKSIYTFNNNGYLVGYQNFFNQEFMLPKNFTKTSFSEIKYFKVVPTSIISKLNSKFNLAQKNYAISKLQKLDTANYIIQNQKNNVHPKLSKVFKYGKVVSLDSIIARHKITLVYFWFQGCEPCIQLKPSLLNIYTEFHAQGLELVGLNNWDKEHSVDTINTPFTTYYDKLKNNKQLKVVGCPTILVFNNKGEIVGKLTGYKNYGLSEMKKHLISLLKD